jgi:hypothetical protein
MEFKMEDINRKYLYISIWLRYLRNSKSYKKIFMDAEVSRPCDKLARAWSIPRSIMEFKMAAVNLKYPCLSTGMGYLRISKGSWKVLKYAELSGPSDDLVRRWSIHWRIMEFKMADINRKFLYLSTWLRYLRNSKGYKKTFIYAELTEPSHNHVPGWSIPGRII